MATRFVRIDLSDEARDYCPTAIEPGVPMLDRSNANAKILFRWVGGMAAEPVWEGDSVNFYVRDDHGGRLEEVICQPAAEHELHTMLKDDVALLRDRIEKAHPETPTERTFRKMLLRTFQELTENPNRSDLDSYFFRYRDLENRWRLVWCWGYQRMDQEPAPSVVCTDPECALLFVRRPGKSPKCPSCAGTLQYRPVRRSKARRGVLLGLLLLLLAAALLCWKFSPVRLVATPNVISGPVGSQFPMQVSRKTLFSKTDVTGYAVGIVLDPAVVRFNQRSGTARLVGPGGTVLRFQLGDLKTEVTLVSTATGNPEKITIEPRSVELGIGTTTRLKLIGQYKDGTTADLTAAAEWKPQPGDSAVFVNGGFLEGVSQGTATVSAHYRATPNAPYLDAAANVSVAKIDFKSLDIGIEPLPIGVGRASPLRLDAVADDGKHYSVLDSSQLKAEVGPCYLASIQGAALQGDRVGRGKLTATFGDNLTADKAFAVAAIPGVDRLIVNPEKLSLLVGEIADLSIVSPSAAPVRVSSSKPGIVEVTAGNRLIGRGEGTAELEVAQGSQKCTVEANVAKAEFTSIAIAPGSVVVPVDDTTSPQVVARVKGDDTGREVELAPDLLTCDKAPSPRYADFNVRRLELRGVMPTDSSTPQTLAMRFGPHTAKAPVEVVVLPLRLELTPAGPVDLPLGQMMRLQGWAHYSGGLHVPVAGERLEWKTAATAAAAAPGLELRGDKVAALKAGGGPLPVYASYFKRQSNQVVFKSVEADPKLVLRVDVDRTIRLAGEPGEAVLAATCPRGDVELVPEMAAFKSADKAIVKIDAKLGKFQAAAPGKTTITGSHAAAKQPATVELHVYNPADAKLVFDPPAVRVAVGEKAQLPLYLEVKDGAKTERALLEGPGIGYSVAQPSAVRWSPSTLIGLSPAKPFALTGGYTFLTGKATAQVEVVPAADASALRIVPATAALAPGQTVSLAVEQQVTGSDQWKEVRADAVSWTVPLDAVWMPPSESLRPALTIPQDAKGEIRLQADFGGKQAVATISVDGKGPDAADAAARLVATREPHGQYLPVGQQQRYAVMVEKDGKQEPAADVRWPADFENQYFKWQAPVLTAKTSGGTQWLRADVGGRTVLLRTASYVPGELPPSINPDAPTEVVILSDQGPAVRFPVGAHFDDFRVEARYADGFTQLVTKKALLTPEPATPLTPSNGQLIGVHPGQTAVAAEFEGVHSKKSLDATVTADIEADEIRVAPAPIVMLPNETIPLGVIGYKGGKSIGDITGIGNIVWQSDHNETARVAGPAVTGVKLGQAKITAKLAAMTSQPTIVSVVDSIADRLKLDPKTLRLHVGEGARIGSDLSVFRGEMEVSSMCNVTSLRPDCVRYDPETCTLVGVSPGAAEVAITVGDKLVNAVVEVLPESGPIVGGVRITPATTILAPGQSEVLRVYVGDYDRTSSAVLISSDPKVAMIQGDRVCAVSPGTAQIRAAVSGGEKSGNAQVVVNDEPITELIAEPMHMAVGDVDHLPVLGKAPCGIHEMFPQDDLKLSVGGATPGAISIAGFNQVHALAQGNASVDVTWRGKLNQQVPVSVTNDPWSDLHIEPGNTTMHPGEAMSYEVTAMKGGQRRVLGPDQGIQLAVGDANVAQVLDGLNVGANHPGRTAVIAKLGPLTAEASLDVTAGEVVAGTTLAPRDDGAITYVPGNVFHTDDTGGTFIAGAGHVLAGNVPAGNVKGLRFSPDVLHMGVQAPASLVHVIEVLNDGTDGPDVTADAKLEVSEPGDVAKVEMTNDGPVFKPLKPGQRSVTAKLGDLTSIAPLLIDVGGEAATGGRLVVTPDPVNLWLGETGKLGTVRIDPGNEQATFAVEYKLTAPEGQGVVSVDGDTIKGLAAGTAQLTVTPTDPQYQALATTVAVQISASDKLTLEPGDLTLKVDEVTPLVMVTGKGADGAPYEVPAQVTSQDPNVLAPMPDSPGHFIAKAMGRTQLKATYKGVEVFSTVTVSGTRFVDVKTTPNVRDTDFDVGIEVLAADSEGPLEYRVYVAGQTPEENWVANQPQPQGNMRQAVLQSPKIAVGAPGTLYHLMIEARDAKTKSVQQYPLTLRSKTTNTIETVNEHEDKDKDQDKDKK